MTTPVGIEQELAWLGERISELAVVIAWHQAKRDWRKRLLNQAQALAQLGYKGPAWKAKVYAVASTEREQINLDVAEAELNMCLERKHANDKLVFTTLGRNKSIAHAYNLG